MPAGLTFLNINSNGQINSLPVLPNSLTSFYCSYDGITCFPNFPNSITSILIDPNAYNCLPNYIPAMTAADLAKPLCAAGNSNGCAIAGIEQFHFSLQVTIYPNPTSDQFYIDANTTDKLNVDLFDVNGRHVFSASVNDKSNINIATLENGVYTLTIKSVDGVTNKKLVIVR